MGMRREGERVKPWDSLKEACEGERRCMLGRIGLWGVRRVVGESAVRWDEGLSSGRGKEMEVGEGGEMWGSGRWRKLSICADKRRLMLADAACREIAG